jgi:V/A-type H+-transporting ATPase subunit K
MKIALMMNLVLVFSTILMGVAIYSGKEKFAKLSSKRTIKMAMGAFGAAMMVGLMFMAPDIAYAADASTQSAANGLGLIGMALSTGLACIGAGAAVGSIGSSALGAISEDPKMMGKALIFIGLGEGIAIYGLIISIIILGKL